MSDIVEVKSVLRTQLTGNAALVALVPADRITSAWPDKNTVYPSITYQELDSFNTDIDRFDDLPICDTFQIEINIWCKPSTSSTPIFKALNKCLESFGWNRDGAADMIEPETKIVRKMVRYSNVLYRVV
jgi:hypothetical protein